MGWDGSLRFGATESGREDWRFEDAFRQGIYVREPSPHEILYWHEKKEEEEDEEEEEEGMESREKIILLWERT